ncbi:ABC transporter ATP-binding protein [Tomitella biformata]|uniref:ABC transporter ATP-binding protein n=1 Tax=Tomitella biformata TaxID=630403 RepID=UPI0004647695|nr:ABC transporter ATP-binding protein [Tomitella biformata]
MGTRALQLTGGRKSYPGRPDVLQGVDIGVDQGEFLVILGRSGSGKSTLLRIMAGLETLDGGNLEWAVEGPRIGVVFQQPLLLPWLNVRENIRLGGRFAANKAAFDAAFADELLTHFGLADLADSYPDQLSGGQAQRIAVIRAVAIRPQALLLDEPFSALDPAIRGDLQVWLGQVASELGFTTVLVTHDVDEAITLGDRIALLGTAGIVRREWLCGTDAVDKVVLRTEILAEYRDTSTRIRVS